jgi:hypothetical protein
MLLPPKPQPRRYASLRLTDAERTAFQAIAKQLHTNPSRILRKVIRELIGQGPDLLAHELRSLDAATYQLNCVGRNLNQLLRTIYTGQVRTAENQQVLIESLRDQVETLAEELDRVIVRSLNRWVIEETPKP